MPLPLPAFWLIGSGLGWALVGASVLVMLVSLVVVLTSFKETRGLASDRGVDAPAGGVRA
ncbi:hypothetical protein [Nonomuraea fuscirosea]|uniref:hypothetical protein n=1 Tax=Nonomuraea fuscirosea TaxID=1291556 RepID=UPI0034381B65